MAYLAVQISVFMVIAFMVGAAAAWLVARFIHQQQVLECELELSGLRRHYDDVALDNTQLRNRLRQQEQVLRKVRLPPSDTDYGKFLQLRKALEQNRRQYEGLLGQSHQQERDIARLKEELQYSKQALLVLQEQMPLQPGKVVAEPLPAPVQPLLPAQDPVTVNGRDDLTRIEGITLRLARKLEALGILTYRQVAEFTADDVQHLQRIMGTDIQPPPESWIQNARALFQQQRQPLQA